MTSPPASPPGPPDDDRTTLRAAGPSTTVARAGRRSTTPVRLIVVLAAAALAVILGVVGGTFVVAGQIGPGSDPSSTPTSTPTPTVADPADAVRGFLDAIARGDAVAALAFAETQPADTSFMTNEVLATAHAANPITEINVPPIPSASDDPVSVQASYKIGTERITDTYTVNLVGGSYRLEEVGAELDLGSERSEAMPMVLAGRAVDSDTVILLPGAYEVTSGLSFVDWGPDNTILVKSPGAFLSASALDRSINTTGEKAFLGAIKASLDACVKIKKVKPNGCPFGYDTSSYTVSPKTISWSFTDDPMAGLEPRLDYDEECTGTVSVSLRLRFKARGTTTYNKEKATIDTSVYDSATATADLTGTTVKITWS